LKTALFPISGKGYMGIGSGGAGGAGGAGAANVVGAAGLEGFTGAAGFWPFEAGPTAMPVGVVTTVVREELSSFALSFAWELAAALAALAPNENKRANPAVMVSSFFMAFSSLFFLDPDTVLIIPVILKINSDKSHCRQLCDIPAFYPHP
jgi:hypothetical protein